MKVEVGTQLALYISDIDIICFRGKRLYVLFVLIIFTHNYILEGYYVKY